MNVCNSCNNSYKQLGNHWQQKPSHRPELTYKQSEIIKGLLMGDGTLDKQSANCAIAVKSTNKKYLEYLDNVFGELGAGVKYCISAEELKENAAETGFDKNAKEHNYSDVYRWRTRTHPQLNQFKRWYKEGGKTFPNDINLSSEVLKHWYVGDGSLYQNDTHLQISIAAANEAGNEEKLDAFFKNANIPSPSTYNDREKPDGGRAFDLRFTKKQSIELLEYMGSPPPGFEYKWPN